MTPSRRELLALLLGAPLAAHACRRPRREVAGKIRGGAVEVGHRLRDATVERASGPEQHVGVAIVGAGPAGLSAAWRLERLGYRDFVVFELEPQPGGTSAYGTDGVVPYPWGAHYLPVPEPENRALVALLDELGALERGANGELRGKEELRIREPEERLFLDGSWHSGLFPESGASAEELAELGRFNHEIERLIRFRDARGRRAFALPMSRCSDDAEVTVLDRVSARRWLDDRGFRSVRLRWYIEYACRDDYGLSLDNTSAWAMLFYYASRSQAAGESSAPFLAWPEGNGRLVRHLAIVAGNRLKTSRLVSDVVPGQDHVLLSALDVEASSLTRYVASHVILAVPEFVAPRILRPWREAPPPHVAGFSYGSWLVANLHLHERPKSRGFPFAWDNVLYESPSLGYVVATHQKHADRGPTIWTYYLPLTDDDPKQARARLLAGDHAGYADAILGDLGRAHQNLENAVDRIDVWRWGHAMVRPTPGFIWGPVRRRAAQAFGRVHFAHSDLSGMALFEEAQDRGVRAAEAVLQALGRDPARLVSDAG
jgi:phytoene dehydrogenase-like protein